MTLELRYMRNWGLRRGLGNKDANALLKIINIL